MARFYQTAQPQFVNDIMYQPPWELMQQGLAGKQKRYDNTLGAIELFKGQLDIKHRQSEADTRAAQEIATYYEDRAQQLANELYKNPDRARDIQLEISKLGRELQSDKKYGNIAKIEGTYNNFSTMKQKLDKAVEKGDLSATDANAMINYYDSQVWKGDTLNEGIWTGEDVIRRPEALDFDKMAEQINKMNPDVRSVVQARPDGTGYMITDEAKAKGITESEIMDFVMGKIRQDPNVPSYYKQRTKFGLSDVYDPDKGALNIVKGVKQIQVEDAQGNKKMKDVPEYYDNELTQFIRAFNPLAYEELEESRKISSDATALAKLRMQHDFSLAKFKSDLKKDEIKFEEALKELPNLVINSQPMYVATPEELGTMSQKYMQYTNNRDSLNPEQEAEYNRISSMYDNLIEKDGDMVLKAARDAGLPLPDNLNMSDEQTRETLKNIVSQLPLLEDPNWGVERIEDSARPVGIGEVVYDYDTSKRDALEAIKDNLDESFGDFNEELANSLVVMESYHPVNNNSVLGRIGVGVLDAVILNNEPVTYDRGMSPRDLKGQYRGQERQYAVDTETGFFTGWMDRGETSNPMRRIMEVTGATSVSELIDQGYGQFTYGQDGNNLVVNFIPNNEKLAEAGIDIDDSGWEQDGLTMRYENLDTTPVSVALYNYTKEYGQYVPPALREQILMGDERYASIKQKVGTNFGSALSAGGPSMSFEIPGISGIEYRIKEHDGRVLIEGKRKGENWNKAKKYYANSQEELTQHLYNLSSGITE